MRHIRIPLIALIAAIMLVMCFFVGDVMANVHQRAGPSTNLAITSSQDDFTVTGDPGTIVTDDSISEIVVCITPLNGASLIEHIDLDVPTVKMRTLIVQDANVQRIIEAVITISEPRLLVSVNAVYPKRDTYLFVALVNSRTVAVHYGGPVAKFIPSALSAKARVNYPVCNLSNGHLQV